MSNSKSYYEYNGVNYDANFPKEWAQNHVPQTGIQRSAMRDNIGPEHCANCIDAFIHHTFVHYCYQCALLFPERHTPIPSHLLTNLTEECLWTYVPYMLGTRIQTIGFKHTNQEEEDRDNKEEDEEGLEGNLGSPEEADFLPIVLVIFEKRLSKPGISFIFDIRPNPSCNKSFSLISPVLIFWSNLELISFTISIIIPGLLNIFCKISDGV